MKIKYRIKVTAMKHGDDIAGDIYDLGEKVLFSSIVSIGQMIMKNTMRRFKYIQDTGVYVEFYVPEGA